jgi:hypothetical protein
MSKEHIYSQATARKHSKNAMAVLGMANMRDGPIGLDGPKARILCDYHNSKLSPLDSEAKILADGLHRFVDGAEYTIVQLDGLLFERWALKTVINHMAAGLGHSKKWLPSEQLVRCAFGLESLPNGCGLYLLRIEDYEPISLEQTGITPVWKGSTAKIPEEMMGAILYLHGAVFFLLLQTHFLEVLETHGVDCGESRLPLAYNRLLFHPVSGQIDDGQGHTMVARFRWNVRS